MQTYGKRLYATTSNESMSKARQWHQKSFTTSMILDKYSSYRTPKGTSLLLVIVVWGLGTSTNKGRVRRNWEKYILGAVMKILHKLQYSET
jgi:hypothetical protein